MKRNKEIEEIRRKLKYDRYFSNPYSPYSQYSNYLFVYITYRYGWSIYPSCTMLFLYNDMDNVLKYASYSSRVFEELGSINPEPKLSIKNLFTIADQVPSHHIYDASYYALYMKSDHIEKEFLFYDEYRKKYAPFEPILEIFDVQKGKELQEEINRRMKKNNGDDL